MPSVEKHIEELGQGIAEMICEAVAACVLAAGGSVVVKPEHMAEAEKSKLVFTDRENGETEIRAAPF